ncbi:MAG: DNA topoisomerase I [Methanomassiliicoccales archaeon]
MKKLVISEKNSVALRLAIILSSGKFKRENGQGYVIFRFTNGDDDYSIIGLRGHIVELDYPKKYNDWERVDPKELIFVQPEKRVLYSGLVNALVREAVVADVIIVATDFDREGELIGVEALDLLHQGIHAGAVGSSSSHSDIRRARFSSLSRTEIVKSFSELHDIDLRLAKSAECRQIIDLAWGASLTRLISLAAGQTGRNFLSVGRVQSPTLALVVRRELEIEHFVPKKYYEIGTILNRDIDFHASHENNPFWEKEEAERVLGRISDASTGTVLSYQEEQRRDRGPSPFSTTLFLMEASRLGYSGSEAMDIAESLYASGLISYPRTDNTVYPRTLSLRGVLEQLLSSDFAPEAKELLALEKLVPTRGNVETTDHPPIYPVGGAKKSKLPKRAWAIYELVVRRFLATVSPDCIYTQRDAVIQINGEKFNAQGRSILEEGWRRYYPYYSFEEISLPALKEGEIVDVKKITMDEKQTKPPARYSQGTLIREMEKLGLGTKSTRHEIIQKLVERRYIEGQPVRPTPVGLSVSLALEQKAPEVCDNKMTAALERDMDLIAEGEKELEAVVDDSRRMLLAVIREVEEAKEDIAKTIREAIRAQRRIGECSKCGGDLYIRDGNGKAHVLCSNYPECSVYYPLPSGYLIRAAKRNCDSCGLPMIRLISKGRKPIDVCVDPVCPSNSLSGSIGKCPSCGRELRIVRSGRGKRFVGCEGYPSCSVTYPLPQFGAIRPSGKACESCGAPIVEIDAGRGRAWRTCINMECPAKKRATATAG